MAWSSFRNMLSAPDGTPEPLPPAAEPAMPQARVRTTAEAPGQRASLADRSHSSLDAIGKRDEMLRQRIDAMVDRLEDIRSLQDDFVSILEPIVSISDELPRASMRIAELETSLAQEFQTGKAVRLEAAELSARISILTNEFSDATARVARAEELLHAREAALAAQGVELRDRVLASENLERRLAAEIEQSKALVAEGKALRAEAQAADSALTRSEHDRLEARETLAAFEQDNRRLRAQNEEQSLRLGEVEARCRTVEAAVETERQKARAAEGQLAAETSARVRIEAQFEADATALRTERSALAMKLEAAANRADSNEQLLGQARAQLRERDEAHRLAERTFKETNIARVTAERRLETIQDDLSRQTERFVEMQRARSDLDSRCEMLGKALAAKDAALEQAAARNAALTERIEQLTHRQEAARIEFEAANRRLSEDLQNERSERALVQGALDIARETRTTLQKQYEALKRSGRGWRKPDGAGEGLPSGQDFAAQPEPEASSNVHPFTSPGTAG
ncbi:chromosome partitioning protein ParA [Methylobacterium sp. J-026]|uniref:chromosome partitioning protein ParA n=1 Tax=Methylobacterium sp. J-026 TaxID=2836624 RepID=UPI001FB92D64|nr:chromosome partitioning protein ParA [Methylobacterium sp. J-026]